MNMNINTRTVVSIFTSNLVAPPDFMVSFIDPTMLPFVGAFLFVFAIVFGALSYAKVLGDQRKVNALIALAFAIFAVLYEPFVMGLQGVLPIGIILIVIIFFILLIKKVFSGGDTFDAWPIAASLIFALLLLGIFWDNIGFSVPGLDSNNVLWLIGVIIVILIFYVAYKHK